MLSAMPRKRKSEKPKVGTGASRTASVALNSDIKDAELRSQAAAMLAKRRMSLLTKKEHKEMSSRGGKNFWAQLTPEERTIEQKRRQVLAQRTRRKNLRKKIGLD